MATVNFVNFTALARANGNHQLRYVYLRRRLTPPQKIDGQCVVYYDIQSPLHAIAGFVGETVRELATA